MKPNKKLAAGLAAALAIAGLATLTVSTEASAYGPSAHTLGGRLYFSDAGVGASASNLDDTISLITTPASPSVGDVVNVRLSGTTGPIIGPASVALGGQNIVAKVILTENGQAPVTLTLDSQNATAMGVIPIGTQDSPPIEEDPGPPATYFSSIGGSYPTTTAIGGSNAAMGAWAADTTYTASTAGATTIAFSQLKFNARGAGASNVDVYFTDGNTCNNPTISTANNANCASAAPNGFTGQHGGTSTNGVDPKAAPVTSPDIIQSYTTLAAASFGLGAGNASNQNVPAYARAGDTFPITVAGFSGATADIQRCAASSTVTSCVTGTSLGTVPLTGGAYTGASPVINTVASGTTAKLCAVQVSPAVTRCSTVVNLLSNPIVKVNGVSGFATQTIPVGTSITISGTNFDPSKALTACGLYSGSGPSAVTYETCPGTAGTVTVAADGSFTQTYPVTTASIGATNGFASQFHIAGPPPSSLLLGFVPVVVSANTCIAKSATPASAGPPAVAASPQTCNIAQNLKVTVTANQDGLRLGQSDNLTNFGSFATQAGDHAHSARLDTTTVQDARGGSVGWTSSAFVANDFSDGAGHSITKDRLAISVACASTTDAGPLAPPATVVAPMAGNVVAGTNAALTSFNAAAGSVNANGVVTNGIPLCNVPTVATGNGGTWTQVVDAQLTIPAYQAAGTYSTLLTVVLTSR